MAEYSSSTVSSILRSRSASARSLSRITGNMPRSMVSTTSAWCSASRASQLSLLDEVAAVRPSRRR